MGYLINDLRATLKNKYDKNHNLEPMSRTLKKT